MNHGMKVAVKFSARSPMYQAGVQQETLRNITEIHYNYPAGRLCSSRPRVAFESDIHRTGFTYGLNDIYEFEAVIETERADEIWVNV